MRFLELLHRCKGQTVVINNGEERRLVDVDEDFVVLQGGNPQMRITEFVPLAHVVKFTRMDYPSGQASMALDLTQSAGDRRRGAAD